MSKYLISFPSGAMTFPDEDLQAVADAAHAVTREAKAAGVWVFGGGIDEDVPPVLVDGSGDVTQGTYPETARIEGGYTVLEVPTRPTKAIGVEGGAGASPPATAPAATEDAQAAEEPGSAADTEAEAPAPASRRRTKPSARSAGSDTDTDSDTTTDSEAEVATTPDDAATSGDDA